MTRSRAKQQPDQYTSVSAQLKIVKVLVGELLQEQNRPNPTSAADADDDDDGDDDWEDDPNEFLDLANGMTKSQLMAYAEEDTSASRGGDDETQAYLVQFFQQQAQKPEFGEVYNSLTAEEHEKLQNMRRA